MGSAATALVDDVRAGLAAAADPVKVPQMRAYMHSTLPYAGVPIPGVRRITKAVFAAHPLPSAAQLDTAAIDANLADKDFFIRKAIGWALRQYARTDPNWVRRFVAERAETMSGLSRREATKHL